MRLLQQRSGDELVGSGRDGFRQRFGKRPPYRWRCPARFAGGGRRGRNGLEHELARIGVQQKNGKPNPEPR